LKEEKRRRRRKSKLRRFFLTVLVLAVFTGASYGIYYLQHREDFRHAELQQIEAIIASGEVEQAIAQLEGFCATYKDSIHRPQALFILADTLNLGLQRYHDAIFTYLTLVKNYPYDALTEKSQREVAEIYKSRLRDYPRAIASYQKILEMSPADGDRIQNEVADLYFRLENFEQARIEFEGLLKEYPDSPLIAEARYRVAVSHNLEGALNAAEEGFFKVMEAHPKSPYAAEAQFGLATLLEGRGELRQALQLLTQLEGVYPNAEALSTRIAQVEERIRKKKKAI